MMQISCARCGEELDENERETPDHVFTDGMITSSFIDSAMEKISDDISDFNSDFENFSLCRECSQKIAEKVGGAWCKHFYGIGPDTCAAGVSYVEGPMRRGRNVRSQCLGLPIDGSVSPCPKRESR